MYAARNKNTSTSEERTKTNNLVSNVLRPNPSFCGRIWFKKEFLVRKGYTVIEVLIVIVTMALLFGVGTASYRSFQRRKVLEEAALRLVGNLRLAQQMAMSGVKPADCTSLDLNLVSVRFQVNASDTYSIVGHCSDGNDYSYNGYTYDLSSDYPGVEFETVPISVVFNTLGRGVESNKTIRIKKDGTTQVRNINITTGGEINISS